MIGSSISRGVRGSSAGRPRSRYICSSQITCSLTRSRSQMPTPAICVASCRRCSCRRSVWSSARCSRHVEVDAMQHGAAVALARGGCGTPPSAASRRAARCETRSRNRPGRRWRARRRSSATRCAVVRVHALAHPFAQRRRGWSLRAGRRCGTSARSIPRARPRPRPGSRWSTRPRRPRRPPAGCAAPAPAHARARRSARSGPATRRSGPRPGPAASRSATRRVSRWR